MHLITRITEKSIKLVYTQVNCVIRKNQPGRGLSTIVQANVNPYFYLNLARVLEAWNANVILQKLIILRADVYH